MDVRRRTWTYVGVRRRVSTYVDVRASTYVDERFSHLFLPQTVEANVPNVDEHGSFSVETVSSTAVPIPSYANFSVALQLTNMGEDELNGDTR